MKQRYRALSGSRYPLTLVGGRQSEKSRACMGCLLAIAVLHRPDFELQRLPKEDRQSSSIFQCKGSRFRMNPMVISGGEDTVFAGCFLHHLRRVRAWTVLLEVLLQNQNRRGRRRPGLSLKNRSGARQVGLGST